MCNKMKGHPFRRGLSHKPSGKSPDVNRFVDAFTPKTNAILDYNEEIFDS